MTLRAGTDLQGLKVFAVKYWRLIEMIRPQLRRVVILILFVQIFALIEPILLQRVIDSMSGSVVVNFGWLCAIMCAGLVALMTLGLMSIMKNRGIRRLWQHLERDVPLRCGEKLLKLSRDYHQKAHSEAVIAKVLKGIGKLMDITGQMCFEILPLALQTIVTAIMIAHYEWRAVMVLLPAVGVFAALTIHVKQRMSTIRQQRYDLDSQADQRLGEVIRHCDVVQAFGQEDTELATVREMREGVFQLEQEEYAANEHTDVFRYGVISAGRVLTLGVCVYAYSQQLITMGGVVLVFTLAERVFISCYRMNGIFDRLIEAMDAVERIDAILVQPITITDPEVPVEVPARLSGAIRFDRVSYAYNSTDPVVGADERTLALRDITLDIPSGEMIGIVGPSGAGKTTFINMLMREADPTSGRVLLDGIDLKQVRRRDFRRQIGIVSQHPVMFDRTIFENIAFAKRDATFEQVRRAAQIANIDRFVMGLEEQYETVVGNNGIILSGGQRQRLAIARAVIIDPPILILDEATSHVDVLSEREIQKAIHALRKGGRTIIVIAHRLPTVRDADRIVVIQDGQIHEVGKHTDLVSKPDGIYRRLVHAHTTSAMAS